MNVKLDCFGQIQTEDSHDGFGIDHISAGYQIKIEIKFGNVVHKGFHLVDRIK